MTERKKLLRLIVENSLENTTVQDTSGPVIVNMILQEENLKKKFEYFLSARYELLDDVLYAKVKDITSGSALIYYDDGQMSRYEISLDILFIDETKGVLEIKEQFGEVNGLTEIIVPEETYVNAIN